MKTYLPVAQRVHSECAQGDQSFTIGEGGWMRAGLSYQIFIDALSREWFVSLLFIILVPSSNWEPCNILSELSLVMNDTSLAFFGQNTEDRERWSSNYSPNGGNHSSAYFSMLGWDFLRVTGSEGIWKSYIPCTTPGGEKDFQAEWDHKPVSRGDVVTDDDLTFSSGWKSFWEVSWFFNLWADLPKQPEYLCVPTGIH